MTGEPAQAPPMDKGLQYWVDLIRAPLETQTGVEIVDSLGGATRFRFRGQIFEVIIRPVDK
jgi:hypothetical protein